MDPRLKKQRILKTRHRRVRRKASGTAERPRLVVSRSLKNIEAQVVDDVAGKSFVGLSSLSKDVEAKISGVSGKCEKSRIVGRLLAEKAIESGIKMVVFDRGGHRFHGRVKALAEGARAGGLEF